MIWKKMKGLEGREASNLNLIKEYYHKKLLQI